MENQEKLATRRRKTKQKHNTVCVGDHYRQTNTNNVNKTWSLLQTTGGKLAAFYSNTCPLMLIAKMKIIITPSEQSFSNITGRTIYISIRSNMLSVIKSGFNSAGSFKQQTTYIHVALVVWMRARDLFTLFVFVCV